jgi:dTDP-4-dehydrorhamnose 3,5-epimerase-like enzyme
MKSAIQGIEVAPLRAHRDPRGFFCEIFRNRRKWPRFQLSHSRVKKGVEKGWHGHRKQSQLTYFASGKFLLVALDYRKGSKTFGQYARFLATPRAVPRWRIITESGILIYYRCLEPGEVIYVTSGPYDPSEELRVSTREIRPWYQTHGQSFR